MIFELFSSLAAPVFAALLLLFFLKSRSREINGGEASSDASGNDGTAGGANHSSTGVSERATSSGPAKDAAANEGTAGGVSGAHTSTGVSEMVTSSGPAKDAAANLGMARADSGALSSGANNDAAAINGMASGDSGTHTSTEVPEIDTSQHDYEVFLSYHGKDTRATFTDHLYTRLTEAGIHTFKDDKSLRDGEEFGPALLRAIKQSKILLPIFSKNYASSPWCLKELAQMVECKKNNTGQKIIPIFYGVGSEEVRCQSGDYGNAFSLYESEKRYDQKIVTDWRDALKAVAKMQGHNMHNRREGEFVKGFTREVFNELEKASLAVSDHFVCVDNHVDAIMEKIGAGTSKTRIIGIHGMGGVGKTTIAKIVFNKFTPDFENCWFLRDIRETSKTSGIQCLQKQLISSILKMECADIKDIHEGTQKIKDRLSNKRVLLLLDDVEQVDHIDALVCERDWLGEGSKIIITSRSIDVLKVPEVDDCYEITGMDRDQSLQLFSKHAFRRDSPLDEYINQSNRAIKIAGGLPLALEVIGSLLFRTKKEMWDDTLKMLERVPPDQIQSKLKISYDALNWRQQHMFLDIACLFIGYDKDILVQFWDGSDFFPEVDMKVLQNLSLIKIIEDNKMWMHDQLRDIGREIVRKESNMKIEKQSRVWDTKVGSDLLRKHKGKKEVQALRLKLEHEHHFKYEGFENLSDLRFLEVDGWTNNFNAEERLLWHESPSIVLPTNENSDLLPQLRWLSWSDFPPTFNFANFSIKDLVILNLSWSEITDDWKGWSHMKVIKNLKVLNLSQCQNLKRLPDELGRDLASLEYLYLRSCISLERLPNSIENMESLIELDISNTGINDLPDSIGKLKNLKRLKMERSKISKIPCALWTIEKLEEIEARSINHKIHVNIGNCIHKNESLRILKLFAAEIYSLAGLPESLITLRLDSLKMDTFPDLSNLTNLKELQLMFRFRESDGLVEVEYPIPQWIGNLSRLESLELTCHFVTTSPIDLTLPPHLKELHLSSRKLRRLPRLPSSLSSLHLLDCSSLCSMGDLSNWKNLSSLQIEGTSIEEIQGLGCLENLLDLLLDQLGQLKLLPDLSNLNKLKCLEVLSCDKLVEIQGELPQSLEKLEIDSCESLLKLPDLSNLKNLSSFHFEDTSIEEIQGLGCLENLPRLQLSRLGRVKILPDLSNLNKLRSLDVSSCPNLVEIQGELPEPLEKLEIDSCESLLKLPDLSNLKNLSSLYIRGTSIEEIQGLGCLENLPNLLLESLGQVKILPDLSKLNELWSLRVSGCPILVEIQGELPESLEELEIYSCESLLKLPDLSNLKDLSYLHIKETSIEEIQGLGCLENLPELLLESLGQVKILPDLSKLNELWSLRVSGCPILVEIQGELPQSLGKLEIDSCESLLKLPDLSSLKNLSYLHIEGTTIEEIQGLDCLENLRDLHHYRLGQVKIIPDLSKLNKLGSLHVSGCPILVEIQGELPQSLEELDIHYCVSLRKLPDLSSLNGLRKVTIECCPKLNVEAISSLRLKKSVKFVGEEKWDGEEDAKSEDEIEDAESESEYDGEDDEHESESEGEEDE